VLFLFPAAKGWLTVGAFTRGTTWTVPVLFLFITAEWRLTIIVFARAVWTVLVLLLVAVAERWLAIGAFAKRTTRAVLVLPLFSAARGGLASVICAGAARAILPAKPSRVLQAGFSFMLPLEHHVASQL
jgi:hypothetical protein